MKTISLERRLENLRVGIVTNDPFFAMLIGRLPLRPDPTLNPPTACTNGRWIAYHPGHFEKASDADATFVLLHEVMHCALLHPWRMSGRDPRLFNVAADYVVNGLLRQAGYKIPHGFLDNPQYDGMTVEQVYAILQNLQQDKQEELLTQPGAGEVSPDPGPEPEPTPSGEPQPDEKTQPKPGAGEDEEDEGDTPEDGDLTPDQMEAEWDIAVSEASNAAKLGGRFSSKFQEVLDEMRRSYIDYRAIVLRFLQTAADDNYSWLQPSRRYLCHGYYLPSLQTDKLGEIVIAVDESGSISRAEHTVFMGDINRILSECRPTRTWLFHFDTKVTRIETFEQDDELKTPHRYSFGGTDYADIFTTIKREEIDPVCVLVLTDNEPNSGWPKEVPPYPVLWISTNNRKQAPWGENVFMDLRDRT